MCACRSNKSVAFFFLLCPSSCLIDYDNMSYHMQKPLIFDSLGLTNTHTHSPTGHTQKTQTHKEGARTHKYSHTPCLSLSPNPALSSLVLSLLLPRLSSRFANKRRHKLLSPLLFSLTLPPSSPPPLPRYLAGVKRSYGYIYVYCLTYL